MKMQKTIRYTMTLLALCILAAFLLAGCRGNTPTTTQPTSAPTTQTTPPTTTLPATTQAPTTQAPTVPTTAPEATQPAPDPGTPMLDIYVAPDGNDANNGLTPETALQTLDGASKLLVASPFAGNVTVHVAEGEYVLQLATTYWRYSNPGYTTYIQGAGQGKTVFTGQVGQDISFITVSTCNDTSISFKDFTVRLVRNGVVMRCSADGSVLTNEGVTGWFENITFEDLGGYYTRNEFPAYAAIQCLGSSNNTIKNCTFDGLRDYGTSNTIHGIYLSCFSSNNLIQGCTFKDIRPDPVRVRRGSSNNIVENCIFDRAGVVAYVSDWHAKEGEDEPSIGNIVRNNEFHGGYYGTQIAKIAVFKAGTSDPSPQNPDVMLETGNTVFESTYNGEVDAGVKNYTVVVDGRVLSQNVPVYTVDRYENYFTLNDLALIFKGTEFAFNYSNPEETTQLTVALGNSFTGTEFTVQPDAAEGEIKAYHAKGWSISNFTSSKGALFEREGTFLVSLDTIQTFLPLSDGTPFEYTVSGDTISFTTIFEKVDIPELIPVYILKVPGSFQDLGANNGRYSMTDLSNFDIVTMPTAELDYVICFRDLLRHDVDFVIVGIPIGEGTWGIREWRNNSMKDYYYYGKDKLKGWNRGWKEASGGYADTFYTDQDNLIYYTIIPVGTALEKPPQYRIKEDWVTGSLSNYTEIFITDSENFVPVNDITAVSAKPVSAMLCGETLSGGLQLYTSALGHQYLNIADVALMLKGTEHGFTFAGDAAAKQLTVSKGDGFSGTAFSGAAELKATGNEDWTVTVDGSAKSMRVISHNGSFYVEAEPFAQALGIECAIGSKGVNLLFSLELPKTVDVLMLNFSGNLENQNATAVDQHKIKMDASAFTVVPTAIEELSGIIDFTKLMRDGLQYTIVGVELKGGIWGVREFKNNTAADYYTYADRKWSTGSGGFSDWFYNNGESTVYYMIVPVGASSDSDPQLRIKQGWEKGSPANYTQIIFTKCAEYLP